MKRIYVLYLALVAVYATLATGWIYWGYDATFGGCNTDYWGFPLPWILHKSCWGAAGNIDVGVSLYLSYLPSVLFGFGVDMLVYMAAGYGFLQVFQRIAQITKKKPINRELTL